MHFDFPYRGETGDGLRDEIGAYTWNSAGNIKLVGSQKPVDKVVDVGAKFGYRCLQSTASSTYISSSGAWSLNAGENYEASLWFRPTASQDGNLFALFNGNTQVFALKVNSSMQVQVICDILSLSLTASSALALSTWHCLRMQITSSLVNIYLGDTLLAQQNISRSLVSATEARIGGAAGLIDEFTFRTSLTSSYQEQPLQGTLSIASLGGFGTGKLGDVSLTKSGTFCATADCKNVVSAVDRSIRLDNISPGLFGEFAPGDEVLVIDHQTGAYDFVNISRISGSTYTFDKFPDVPMATHTTYFVQVPHFNTLTIPANIRVRGRADSVAYASGIIAFRCKGNCNVQGYILTNGQGKKRTDTLQMTHAQLADRFLFDEGGFIFIACGGIFTASSNARIGATWSGAGDAGTSPANSDGTRGGAGYGGGGANNSSQSFTGNNGVITGGVGIGGTGHVLGSAGGDPGKSGNDNGATAGGHSGTCLVLLAKTLSVDDKAISTGGAGGICSQTPSGGGGTGFCYIACERMA